MILTRDSFKLNEVFDSPIEKAYVFCEYTYVPHATELGFDESDFYDIDHHPSIWETHTGIGVLFTDGTKPYVEWFSPKK